MTTATDRGLHRAIDAISIPGALIGHRQIASGDEFALWPEEEAALARSVAKVKRASGAARIVARELMQQLGAQPQALPRGQAGAPIWPEGLVGSLAHDSSVAVAAIAKRENFLSLGIDIEPAEPLEAKLLPMVATSRELTRISDDPCRGRLLFATKEAVYKAAYPLDGHFLDHQDVEVDFAAGTAGTRTGKSIQFRYSVSTHILVLAYI